jgi:hypothetical protein
MLKKTEKKLARSSNFTFRYIDDALSLNNSMFSDFVNRIYPNELEIKDTADTEMYASYTKKINMLSIENSSMLMITFW